MRPRRALFHRTHRALFHPTRLALFHPTRRARPRLLALLLLAISVVVIPPGAPAEAGTIAVAGIAAIDGGSENTCAVFGTGVVSCWGSNLWKLTGPHGGSRSVPTTIAGLTDAVDVAVGGTMACALSEDGTVSCWGQQLEFTPQNTVLVHNVPTGPTVGVAAAVDVAVAGSATCVALAGGSVKCWGSNHAGQVGQPLATTYVADPTTVPGLTGVVRLAGRDDTMCALRSDATARCWGANDEGQLGRDTGGAADPVPASPTGLTGVLDIDVGASHTCAVVQVASNEQVFCWGDDLGHQLGTAVPGATTVPTTAVADLNDVVQVAVGYRVSCALRATGSVECWGMNDEGQLGRGFIGPSADTPAPVVGASDVDSISAMSSAVCARSGGSVECWGKNSSGKLGRGDNVERYVVASPVVVGLSEFVAVDPARLLDTRSSGVTIDGQFQAGGPVGPGGIVELTVAGRGDAPVAPKAVTLNVTSVGATGPGYVTVWPCDQPKPNASVLNVQAGITRANLTVVKVPTSGPKAGKVCLSPSVTMHLVADLGGFLPSGSPYVGLTPARLVDTRSTGETVDGTHEAGGALAVGVPTYFQIAGRGGVPGSVGAAVLNVTAANPVGKGYVTVYPCGDPPVASNLNVVAGVNVANLVVAKLDVAGGICVVASVGTHLVVDVVGYMPTTMDYDALTPVRLADTRPGGTTVDGKAVGAGPITGLSLTVGLRGPVRVARSVVLNVTVVSPPANGYLTVYSCTPNAGVPLASTLNFTAGSTTPNSVIVQVGLRDSVCIVTSVPANVIVDLQGLFAY